MKAFERVEHTADVGIRAFGHDLKELFSNAVMGMMDILFRDVETAESGGDFINMRGKDLPELLVNVLEEILYHLNVKHFLTKSIRIESLGENELTAQLMGERLDPGRHFIEYDIKGVTFHQLEFEKKGDLLTVQVIFDI